MLDLGNDELLEVKAFDKDFKVRYPSAKEFFGFQQDVKKLEDDQNQSEVADRIEKFLVAIGVPQDVYDKMSISQITKLMEHVGSKKK